MICATQCRFHVVNDCVQPLEEDFRDVPAARLGSGPEEGQAIREDSTSR